MKLSAILVSVNMVAVVPVAAQAAEEAVSDKAEWLKQNLASIDKTGKTDQRKISLSDTNLCARANDGKLRPFVKNRKLPSKRDIETQLSAEQARLDDRKLATQAMLSQQAPIPGQVSAYGMQPDPSPYTQIPASLSGQTDRVTRRGRSPAQRAIPGQIPSLPGQVAALPAPGAVIPRIPEPPGMQSDSGGDFRDMQRQQAQAAFEQPPQAGERTFQQSSSRMVQVQAPSLTPDQQKMYDELLELNQKSNSQQFVDFPRAQAPRMQQSAMFAPGMQQSATFAPGMQQSAMVAPARKDPGPPPFPLNMLPQDALKQLIGAGRAKIDAPPAYFGSWHKQPTGMSNLPESGFHSNIARRGSGQYYGHYASNQTSARAAQVKRRRTEYAGPSAQTVAFHQPEVAMYPPYGPLNLSR